MTRYLRDYLGRSWLTALLFLVIANHAPADGLSTADNEATPAPHSMASATTNEDALTADAGVPAADASDYVLTDLPPDTLLIDTEHFQVRPIVAIVGDYTFFRQDADSLAQVGEQDDTQDLRAARFGAYLRPKSGRAWEFFVALDYQERRTRSDQTFQLYDLRFRVPIGRVNFDIGKQKQPFSFEIAGLSILFPQQERILSPFFVTRSIGIKASGQAAGDRMTWAVGWFNDWLENNASFTDSGNDLVARVTGLLHSSADNRNWLHVGLGVRRAGPDPDVFRLSGRPESNVADRYLDTGEFEADSVREVGFELAWQRGPLLLLGEHILARAQEPAIGNPDFRGSYLLASWMLTGENRPYLRSVGSFGPVTPITGIGAFELVTRYSHLDLSDAAIDGGDLRKWHYGLNWWISRQWKAGLSYGDADLHRAGLTGNTKLLLLRMQWFY